LQAKYAVELLDERDREGGEVGGNPAISRKGMERGQRDNDENGKKDPVLKNADEAEVKESCTRPKSQADLIVVFVRFRNLPSFVVV